MTTLYVLRGNRKAMRPVSIWNNPATESEPGPLVFATAAKASDGHRRLEAARKGYVVAPIDPAELDRICEREGWRYLWTMADLTVGTVRMFQATIVAESSAVTASMLFEAVAADAANRKAMH